MWRDKVIEVVDRYHPDIIYFDNRVIIIPNTDARSLSQPQQVCWARSVMTYKDNDFATNSGIIDIEAGQLTEKAGFVWQTERCVGLRFLGLLDET